MAMLTSLIGGAAGLIGQIAGSMSGSSAQNVSQAATTVNSYTHKPSRHEKLVGEALAAQGFDEETIADIQAQINDAVGQLKAQGSVSKKSVKYTVDGILQQNGVDLTKFEAYMQAHRPQRKPTGTTQVAAESAEQEKEVDTYA